MLLFHSRDTGSEVDKRNLAGDEEAWRNRVHEGVGRPAKNVAEFTVVVLELCLQEVPELFDTVAQVEMTAGR